MKGKILGILLFFCFVAPLATTFVVLQYQKQQVKTAVKRKIATGFDKKELVLLKFTKEQQQTQLKWEHAQEFEYQDEMYDIIETKMVGDTAYYWCWWDHEETKLNKQLDELAAFIQGNHAKQKENQQRLYDFFKSLCLPAVVEKKSFMCLKIKMTYFWEQLDYQSLYNSPPVPPPELKYS